MDNYKENPYYIAAQGYYKQGHAKKHAKNWLEAYFYFTETLNSFYTMGALNDDHDLRIEVKKAMLYLNEEIEVLRTAILHPDESISQVKPQEIFTSTSSGTEEGKEDDEKLTPVENAKKILKDKLILKPSSLGGVKWNDIQGCSAVKTLLQTKLVLPSEYPQYADTNNTSRNVLFYGAPGCGKSMFGKVVANEVGAAFLNISASDILSRWMGIGESRIRAMFEMARENAPCIIFIDEIECLFASRDEGQNSSGGIVQEFLYQADGVDPKISNEGVTILAASNYPWLIDIAALRRFGSKVFIDLPDEATRNRIFRHHMKSFNNLYYRLSNSEFLEIAKQSMSYSGSDLKNLVSDLADLRWIKTRSAKYFRRMEGMSPVTKKFCNDLWAPCHADDRCALKKNINDVEPNKLILPLIEFQDVEICLKNRKASTFTNNINKEKNTLLQSHILEKLSEFRKKYGVELQPGYKWEDKIERERKLQETERQNAEKEEQSKKKKAEEEKLRKNYRKLKTVTARTAAYAAGSFFG